MKGLLIKDWKLLMGQKQFFVTVCGLGFLFTFVNGDPTFAVPYVAMMLCMFSVGTISYDEYDNGGAFLFSLPITRKVYVAEKYVYGFGLCLLSLMVTSVFAAIIMIAKNSWMGTGEFVSILVVSMVISAIVLDVMIPAQLKFGAEKSRVALMGVVLGIYIIGYFGYMLLQRMGIDLELILAAFSGMTLAVGIAVLCGIGVVITMISYMISWKIMENKEY